MHLNVRGVTLLRGSLNTNKQVLNTAGEVYYESLAPLIVFPFLMLPQAKPSLAARLTMVCLRRVDLSVNVRQQRPHM